MENINFVFELSENWQEGNEFDVYDLNHPKLKRHPFMTLNVMVVGKFYDNFDGLTAKQSQCDMLDCHAEDDPHLLAGAEAHEVGVHCPHCSCLLSSARNTFGEHWQFYSSQNTQIK